MKFSTRTTYGLRAMVRLARNRSKYSLPLPLISREENISLGYLESLFSKLKKAELIMAVKGVKGGYRLSRPAKNINIFDIVKALEGEITSFKCVGEDGKIKCRAKKLCSASAVLVKVQQSINKTLSNIKLSDLI